MLKYATVFALISLVAYALASSPGVAVGAAGIAKVLFSVFLILTLIFVVLASRPLVPNQPAIKVMQRMNILRPCAKAIPFSGICSPCCSRPMATRLNGTPCSSPQGRIWQCMRWRKRGENAIPLM